MFLLFFNIAVATVFNISVKIMNSGFIDNENMCSIYVRDTDTNIVTIFKNGKWI